jgi:RNA polymerase sigma factor (TIGR02999 family)
MPAKVLNNQSAAQADPTITELLVAWSRGEQDALNRLIPLVYDELRWLAHRHLRQERRGHTLQSTAVVHEAYQRLIDSRHVHWRDRAHFFAVAAQLMRRVLVDYARSRNYQKRGGGVRRVAFDDALMISLGTSPDLVALDDALTALSAVDARKSRVVELRFFGGLTVEETAEILKISEDTVLRDWQFAKTWLLRELKRKSGPRLK